MPTLHQRIVELLSDRKMRVEHEFGGVTKNPFTLEPGWTLPDPFPAGCSDADIRTFERHVGFSLPTDLRQFLKISNGASGFYGISPSTGRNKIEEELTRFPVWHANRWLPVEYDNFGNYYVKVIGDEFGGAGAVCFVESLEPDRLVHAVASDVLHFAEFTLEASQPRMEGDEHLWPHDKEFVLEKDPDLENVTIAPLPWNLSE